VLLLVWDDPTSRNILGYKTVSNAIYFMSPLIMLRGTFTGMIYEV
jgi:hypothetical protein